MYLKVILVLFILRDMDGVFLQCKLINQKFLVFTIINTPQFSFTLRKVLKGAGGIYVPRAVNTLNPSLGALDSNVGFDTAIKREPGGKQ